MSEGGSCAAAWAEGKYSQLACMPCHVSSSWPEGNLGNLPSRPMGFEGLAGRSESWTRLVPLQMRSCWHAVTLGTNGAVSSGSQSHWEWAGAGPLSACMMDQARIRTLRGRGSCVDVNVLLLVERQVETQYPSPLDRWTLLVFAKAVLLHVGCILAPGDPDLTQCQLSPHLPLAQPLCRSSSCITVDPVSH